MRIINRFISISIICISMLLACSSMGFSDTLAENLNNLQTPRAMYNTELSNSYYQSNQTSEYVDPQSGELVITQTDYVLPGRNGLDLEIKRMYKSSVANGNIPSIKTTNLGSYDHSRSGITFYQKYYGLDQGWRFSFPMIEVKFNKSDDSEYMFYHSENGAIYEIDINKTEEDDFYSFKNRTLQDLVIEQDDSYNNGQNSNESLSKYVIRQKDGKSLYFSASGRILGIQDRYGNTINFNYADIIYRSPPLSPVNYSRTLITKITDSLGRDIVFDYHFNTEQYYVDRISICLPDSTDETLEDNEKISYLRDDFNPNPLKTHLFFTTVIGRDGNSIYEYNYDYIEHGYTFFNGDNYSAIGKYTNLNQINYSRTNRITRFEYDTFVKSLGSSGSMEYSKVVKKTDLAQTGWDDSRSDYFDKFLCTVEDEKTYTYWHEPDGYGVAGYDATDETYLADSYKYRTTILDLDGSETLYVYNGLHELVRKRFKGDDHKTVIRQEYNSENLPVKTSTEEYHIVNGNLYGDPVVSVENSEYDIYGNLLSYTGPMADRDQNKMPLNDNYTTFYTYATDRYHMCTSKQWKIDGSKTRRTEYSINTDGNVTQKKDIHIEDGVDQSIISDYLYDSYGNLTQETVDGAIVKQYEYGTDLDGTDHQGAYLTKSYTMIDGEEVSQNFVYNFYTGNRKAVVDPDGNRTNYFYDALERISTIVYPDGSQKSYDYYDFWNEDSYVTISGAKELPQIYTFDIFGNITSEQMLANDVIEILGTYEYDSNGNLSKYVDANGREMHFSYDSKERIIGKSWWSDYNSQEKAISVEYLTNYQGTVPLLKRITDSEGYTSEYYYNKANKLYEIRETDNKQDYYTITQSYDFAGNPTVNKDKNNQFSYLTYDDLGRLVGQRDALNNETQFTYDSFGNMVQATYPNNQTVVYEYDLLGRRIKEERPSIDGSIATTRFFYDKMGNLTKRVLPNEYDVLSDTPELSDTMLGIVYEYDVMNRRIKTTAADDNVLEYVKYDINGNIKKVVDGLRYTGDIDLSLGTTFTYEYGDFGERVSQIEDALGNTTSYTYDLKGQLKSETDQLNNTTQYEYRYDGLVTKVIYPDASFVEFGYDNIGNRTYEKDENGNITEIEYNGFGHVETITDALNQTIEYSYDPNGNQTSVTDRRGITALFSYDELNRLVLKEVPIESNGSAVEYSTTGYAYNNMGNLIQETVSGTINPLDSRDSNYTYYDNGLLDMVTTNAGKSQKYYYDANGNTIKMEESISNGQLQVAKMVYDINNRVIKNIRLVEEDLIYDSVIIPNVANLVDPEYAGKIMLINGYQYDMVGNLVKEVDPRAYGYLDTDTVNRDRYTTTYTYDPLNRLEKTSMLLDGQPVYTQNFYDAKGNLTSQLDQKAGIVTYTYDVRDRLATMTDQLLNLTTYGYDSAGNQVSITDARSHTYTYDYDALNRIMTVTDPYDDVQQRIVYDEEGNIIKDIDAKGYLDGITDETRFGTHYEYNMAGLMVEEIDPVVFDLGDPTKFTARYQYNQYGELITETNGENETTSYQYNNAGKLVSVTDALNIQTIYSYDMAGNMVSMMDGLQKQTLYGYGDFGILANDTNPEGLQRSYGYDLALNLVSEVDRNGNHMAYVFDPRNLLTSKSVAETNDLVTWQYDELGSRVGMADESGTYAYSYDALGRLLNIQESGQLQIGYTYDAVGNVKKVTDKNGLATTYDYDSVDRIYKVSQGYSKISYWYDDNSNITKIESDSNRVNSDYSYDKNDRILEVTNKRGAYGIISSYVYSYDLAGRTVSKTDLSGQTSYTYDDVGRIVGVQAPDKTVTYQHDTIGNRSLMTETYAALQGTGYVDEATQTEIQFITKTSQYSYSNANKLMSLTEVWSDGQGSQVLQDTTAYTYDNNGNEVSTISGWRSMQSVYDGFNRLENKATTKDSIATTVGFVYNGDDLRVERTIVSTEVGFIPETTKFFYDRLNVLLTTDELGNTKERLIIGNGYEGRIDDLGMISFFHKNGHGDIVQTVSKSGNVQNQYDYDIFGNTTLEIEQYPFQIRYAGEYYDKDAELYYLRARHYNPSTGRFVSEDTYLGDYNQPSTLNLYTYCINNPLSYVDPSGHRIMNLTQGSTGIEAVEQVNEINSSASEPVVAPTVQDIVGQSQTTTIGEMAIANGYAETVAIGTGGTNNDVSEEYTNSDASVETPSGISTQQHTTSSSSGSRRRNNEIDSRGKLELDSDLNNSTNSGTGGPVSEGESQKRPVNFDKIGKIVYASSEVMLGGLTVVGSAAYAASTGGVGVVAGGTVAVVHGVNSILNGINDFEHMLDDDWDAIGDENYLRDYFYEPVGVTGVNLVGDSYGLDSSQTEYYGEKVGSAVYYASDMFFSVKGTVKAVQALKKAEWTRGSFKAISLPIQMEEIVGYKTNGELIAHLMKDSIGYYYNLKSAAPNLIEGLQ
ncbi:hypothetical protein SANA_01300 [Gottschalkiaceae bacterium SANA]|nr:hypothetical protein SANA_01300 [Gottschalkiaceae bacterium SANA]